MGRMGLMRRGLRLAFCLSVTFCSLSACSLSAQTPAGGTSTLRAIHVEGSKQITEEQIVTLSGLQAGSEVTREDLQAAADRLVQTGLFANVKYNFVSKPD